MLGSPAIFTLGLRIGKRFAVTKATTILDVLSRAASDPAFGLRFAREPGEAARSLGMRNSSRYVDARLSALAHPLEPEPGPVQLREAAEDLRACFRLDPQAAATAAKRARFFLRDHHFHQRLLNGAPAGELTELIGGFEHEDPSVGPGTLLVTLHYGPFPLLWLHLKHAVRRGVLPPCSLLYDARLYEPDLPPEQYDRLAGAGAVPRKRRDLDMAALGVRRALTEAVARLRAGETVLMFPDGFPAPPGGRSLVCRVGRLEVAYPRGAVWLAGRAGATVQGVAIRPSGDGHAVYWGSPRTGPTAHEGVAEALQELFDATVARDPAPWLAWFDEG
jgi:hypothetical protein